MTDGDYWSIFFLILVTGWVITQIIHTWKE